ncbi:hypothetical protein AV530_014913 [Patagioenas fasciata monilis]|uniref:Uncharacterized protein n=1 Tax=Patagioenas fasciata monilis TaxID=372326 RepID=A0A1V4K0J3_PATFA|nr:hypothetical protein AV530_014913 [Patagioenas fasciata monilis]
MPEGSSCVGAPIRYTGCREALLPARGAGHAATECSSESHSASNAVACLRERLPLSVMDYNLARDPTGMARLSRLFIVVTERVELCGHLPRRQIPAEEHWFNGRNLDLRCRPESRIVPCGCGSVTVTLPRVWDEERRQCLHLPESAAFPRMQHSPVSKGRGCRIHPPALATL